MPPIPDFRTSYDPVSHNEIGDIDMYAKVRVDIQIGATSHLLKIRKYILATIKTLSIYIQ